jgi:hypothetical protein
VQDREKRDFLTLQDGEIAAERAIDLVLNLQQKRSLGRARDHLGADLARAADRRRITELGRDLLDGTADGAVLAHFGVEFLELTPCHRGAHGAVPRPEILSRDVRVGDLAHLADACVTEISRASPSVAVVRLRMSGRISPDPPVGPGRWDRQIADPGQRRWVSDRLSSHRSLSEAGARLATGDARRFVADAAQASLYGGTLRSDDGAWGTGSTDRPRPKGDDNEQRTGGGPACPNGPPSHRSAF